MQKSNEIIASLKSLQDKLTVSLDKITKLSESLPAEHRAAMLNVNDVFKEAIAKQDNDLIEEAAKQAFTILSKDDKHNR